jgi:hypothetical protein
MGLGGLTRDSIVGLNNLVHNDDDDNNVFRPLPLGGKGRSGSFNSGDKLRNSFTGGGGGRGGDEFLFLDNNNEGELSAQDIHCISLNDDAPGRVPHDIIGGYVGTVVPTPSIRAAQAAATAAQQQVNEQVTVQQQHQQLEVVVAFSSVSATNSR